METIPLLGSEHTGHASQDKHALSDAHLLAHDTRNWLGVLRMYCDLLRTCGARDERSHEWVQEISAAVDRGYGLVNDLLRCAQTRVEERWPIRPRRCFPAPVDRQKSNSAPADTGKRGLDLAAAIACRLPVLRHLAGDRIRVSLKMESQPVRALVPEADFDRILMNLAANAIEAMPGGGELRITLESMHLENAGTEPNRSRRTLLRVSDTGTGISPLLLPRIFQPGVSGKVGGEEEHGLGLAAVRELTLRAGGSIRVSSHCGGTCFEIDLPAEDRPRETTIRILEEQIRASHSPAPETGRKEA